MAKFGDPVEFSAYLARKKVVWKQSIRSRARYGAKRHFKDLVRKEVRVFRKAFGSIQIPKIAFAQSSDDWQKVQYDEVHVILSAHTHEVAGGEDAIQAVEFTYDEANQDTNEAKKALKRGLKPSDSRNGIELINAKNVKAGDQRAVVARSTGSASAFVRGVWFEHIGAAVVPSLSASQVSALEAEGLVVMQNKPLILEKPLASSEGSLAPSADWHLAAIGIDNARRKGLTGKNVTIGILDTGIDAGHPEFVGKHIDYREFDCIGLPKMNSAAIDFDSHGTHVAGLSAGKTVGVAPEASLAIAAVLTTRTPKGMVGYIAQIIGGLNWLASEAGKERQGVDVINASLGTDNASKEFYNVFRQHHELGRLTVAAVGNKGLSGVGYHDYPGRYDFTIAVGACDHNDNVADFSAWGKTYRVKDTAAHKPDLVAPGVFVRSALPKGGYGEMNGTSMACPIVTGVAALLIQKDEALRRDPTVLKRSILDLTCSLPTTSHNGDARRYGRGRLDLSSIG